MPDDIQDDRPDWLPEKFASPEALAQSYAETEKEMHRMRSELETQRDQFSAALAAIEEPEPQQQGQWSPQADPTMIAMQQALEQGDAATFAAIQLQLNQAAMQQAVAEAIKPLQEQFSSANTVDREVALKLAEQQVAPGFGDEWADLAPKVTERLRGRPDLLPQVPTVEGYAAALAEQAKLVRYDTLEAQAKAEAAERQAKLNAQTLSGSVARTPIDTDAKRVEWDAVKNADVGSYSKLAGG